jgi:TonB family protein
MRKSAISRPLYCRALLVCLVSLGFAAWGAHAQDSTPSESTTKAAQPTPSDPKELMLQAAKLNGLMGDDIRPWRLKANYELLGDDGKPTDQGTYEEFWVSPTKYKRIYTGNDLTQTNYGSDKGELRAGAHGEVPAILVAAGQDLVSPLPNPYGIEHTSYVVKLIDNGGLKLNCITAMGQPNAYRYCLSTGEPLLRVLAWPSPPTNVLYNRILRFNGRAVAGDLKMVRDAKVVATLHIESLEALGTIDESVFTPPPDAVPVPRMVSIAGGVAAGMLLRGVAPSYPTVAKDQHVSGTVVLRGSIGKDGRIKDLKVISGDVLLQQAALDAVRQWNTGLTCSTAIRWK